MKRRFLLWIVLFTSLLAKAQYNNEWIDYNKTYYKFKVGSTNLYRITQPMLNSVGIGNVPADQFQLWRNGQQVAIFTSVASGAMGAGDYIEFWGEMNDGKPDTKLYSNPSFQISDQLSLETDTAAFFLTVNPAGGNLRVVNDANNVAGNVLPAESFFMYKLRHNFRSVVNGGRAEVIGAEYVYSSVYDDGEGLSTSEIYTQFPWQDTLGNLYVYNSGPAATLTVAGSGAARNGRNFEFELSNVQVVDYFFTYFGQYKTTGAVPLNLINGPTTPWKMTNNSPNLNDRSVVSFWELNYPHTYNFEGARNFSFELPATATGNFLQITNFNYGSAAPVLYDLTNSKRYIGDISTPGTVKFALPASAQPRKLSLASLENPNIKLVTELKVRNFINFLQTDQQGNYLIISNPLLYSGPSGNSVDRYRAYRSSPAGGGFNAKIYETQELVDQFAFGIKSHPSSVKNFIKFARNNFASPPQFVFIIGKGVTYNEYRKNESSSSVEKLNLVPTFGYPASDNLLAANDYETLPAVPIGRLGAVSGNEVEIYLTKTKEYEQAAVGSAQTIAGKAWMKNVVHAIGGSDPSLQAVILGYMEANKQVLEDTLMGANVYTFSKNSAFSIQQITSSQLQNLFAEGLGLVTYFGHSSANTLEFNLDDPQVYNNPGKYPVFLVNGCNAGNFYVFDSLRFASGNSSLSEKYTLANQRGSIAFVASTHFGIVSYLNIYTHSFYDALANADYGKSIGAVMQSAAGEMLGITGIGDYFSRFHVEQMTLQGDPAIKMYYSSKPDYIIEDALVKIDPAFVSVADNRFTVTAKFLNIGKAIEDSIFVEVKRELPGGTSTTLIRKKIAGIKYADSVVLTVPINPLTDKGTNKITVTVDVDNNVDEILETNNSLTKEFFIIEDEARPIYPFNYSIITTTTPNFYASAANPFSAARDYVMEIDTTELFNSSSKVSKTINSTGGVLQFNPSLTLRDSVVYYWRVSPVPTSGGAYLWNNSSFVYLSNSTPGFNQSHFYQYKKNDFTRLTLDDDREFRYQLTARKLRIKTGLYPYFINDKITVSMDDDFLNSYGCKYSTFQIMVYDSLTYTPWQNFLVAPGQGRFGSADPTCQGPVRNMFEFFYNTPASRKAMMDFLDSIPKGMYVSITNFSIAQHPDPSRINQSFIDQWKSDTTLYGPGKSLYHKFVNLGLIDIDEFTRNLPFLFYFRKGSVSTPIYQFMGPTESSYIDETFDINVRDKYGEMQSPWFGPAKTWKAFHWRGNSRENPTHDSVVMSIYGKDYLGNETLVGTIWPAQDTNISFINAATYPFLKLKMVNVDSVNGTPNQLRYWRLNADMTPEGSIAPNVYFKGKDTLELGEKFDFSVAFKNISETAFDSMTIRMVVTDKSNVAHNIVLPKKKPLVAGDTLIVSYSLDTKDYSGANQMFVYVNPDYAQPEQYMFNNFLYKSFFVRTDNFNPLLDVTFDGVHILNKDIVSARPNVLITLKDDSRYLALDDTSLMNVQLIYPDGSKHLYKFDGDTMRFTPSTLQQGGKENTATIEFLPSLLQDGEYELVVSGKDKSGNKAGSLDYRVTFTVINKPMISNLLNYPNPFTTSTAFVFTVTGSEIPTNIKIQILTITGKIVREITKDELGPIHIGRNITEFKWDGTDMYGAKLANGVYLYRVVTSLHGKSMDKYKSEADDTDKYFNKGYGKMYLMR